jgi:hypothetical protein
MSKALVGGVAVLLLASGCASDSAATPSGKDAIASDEQSRSELRDRIKTAGASAMPKRKAN